MKKIIRNHSESILDRLKNISCKISVMSILGAIIDKIFYIIFLPIYIFAYFFYDINNIKKTVLNDFFSFYKDENFNIDNYKLKIELFSGFTIINKHTGITLATSYSLTLKNVRFELPVNCFNSYPIRSDLRLTLNEYFELCEFLMVKYNNNDKSFIYQFMLIDDNESSDNIDRIRCIQFVYNEFSKLIETSLLFTDYNNDNIIHKKSFFDYDFPFEDLFDLIILDHMSKNSIILNLFPEINIPSAYDFSDFKERIEMAKMIYY